MIPFPPNFSKLVHKKYRIESIDPADHRNDTTDVWIVRLPTPSTGYP